VTQPGFRIEPVSIVGRAPPAVSHSLVSSNPRRTKQSSSLSRSTNERRSPESCSSFRSSEEPYAGFATVAFGCLRRARLGVLPVGSSRAPAVARVGVVGPTRARSDDRAPDPHIGARESTGPCFLRPSLVLQPQESDTPVSGPPGLGVRPRATSFRRTWYSTGAAARVSLSSGSPSAASISRTVRSRNLGAAPTARGTIA
jgi:hypothetical protein